MTDFSKNRSSFIKRILNEVSGQEFEYEPLEIIQALMENEHKPKKFKDRKLEEQSFFSNSHTYIKKRGTNNDK